LAALQLELDNLRQEFEAHNNFALSNLNELNVTMPTKADKSDLAELDRKFKDRLNECIRQLMDHIPNKDDLAKKFAAINKKLKELFELVKNSGGNHEDDAMFTKKHLGPMNCASCEKDIVNLIGQPVDHYNWKRMPMRNQPDRIARYGQGFSKLLNNLQYQQDNIVNQSLNQASMDDSQFQKNAGYSPMKTNGNHQHLNHTANKTGDNFFRGKKTNRNKSMAPNRDTQNASPIPGSTTIDDSQLNQQQMHESPAQNQYH